MAILPDGDITGVCTGPRSQSTFLSPVKGTAPSADQRRPRRRVAGPTDSRRITCAGIFTTGKRVSGPLSISRQTKLTAANAEAAT